MKKLFVFVCLLWCCSTSFAQQKDGEAQKHVCTHCENCQKEQSFTWTRKQDMYANYEGVSMQGADIYKGKLYQFYDKGKALLIYDVATGKLLETKKAFAYPGASETHFGSIAFSNQTKYTNKQGKKVKLTLPLVYASGHMKPKNSVEAVDDKDNYEFVDVVDIENDVLVQRIKFRNRYDDVICAWDFAQKRGWVVGYVKTGYATSDYSITSFKFGDVDSEGYIKETDAVTLPNDGTLQDCVYTNGHIYFLVGWGTNAKRSTLGKIHDYDVLNKKINTTFATDVTDECEGLALDAAGNRFIITSRCIYGANKGQGSWWDVNLSK